MRAWTSITLYFALLVAGRMVAAGENAPAGADRPQVVKAVERGVALLQKSARSYPTHRKCFACHHQTLPLLALSEAQSAGIAIDKGLPESLAEFTRTSFRGKMDELKAGDGIGGKGLTVGYGLWTLRLAGIKPDDLTEAMATFLLKTQEEDGHWALHAIRPPAEESLVMCTVLAAAGLKQSASESQREEADKSIERARNWLTQARLELQEDKTARLWGCHLLGATADDLAAARKAVLDSQQADGGWSPIGELESDAYATGATLYVLLDTGLSANDPAVQRGIARLVQMQLPDGSWHVRKRAKPVQVFFDNGDPHGEDQFISIAATGWSVAALSLALGPAAGK